MEDQRKPTQNPTANPATGFTLEEANKVWRESFLNANIILSSNLINIAATTQNSVTTRKFELNLKNPILFQQILQFFKKDISSTAYLIFTDNTRLSRAQDFFNNKLDSGDLTKVSFIDDANRIPASRERHDLNRFHHELYPIYLFCIFNENLDTSNTKHIKDTLKAYYDECVSQIASSDIHEYNFAFIEWTLTAILSILRETKISSINSDIGIQQVQERILDIAMISIQPYIEEMRNLASKNPFSSQDLQSFIYLQNQIFHSYQTSHYASMDLNTQLYLFTKLEKEKMLLFETLNNILDRLDKLFAQPGESSLGVKTYDGDSEVVKDLEEFIDLTRSYKIIFENQFLFPNLAQKINQGYQRITTGFNELAPKVLESFLKTLETLPEKDRKKKQHIESLWFFHDNYPDVFKQKKTALKQLGFNFFGENILQKKSVYEFDYDFPNLVETMASYEDKSKAIWDSQFAHPLFSIIMKFKNLISYMLNQNKKIGIVMRDANRINSTEFDTLLKTIDPENPLISSEVIVLGYLKKELDKNSAFSADSVFFFTAQTVESSAEKGKLDQGAFNDSLQEIRAFQNTHGDNTCLIVISSPECPEHLRLTAERLKNGLAPIAKPAETKIEQPEEEQKEEKKEKEKEDDTDNFVMVAKASTAEARKMSRQLSFASLSQSLTRSIGKSYKKEEGQKSNARPKIFPSSISFSSFFPGSSEIKEHIRKKKEESGTEMQNIKKPGQ